MSEYTIEKHTPIDGEYLLVLKDGALYAKAYSDENARRIVACVNACEGISTETLEKVKLADVGDIQDALRDCMEALEDAQGYVESSGWTRHRGAETAQVESAITNARKTLKE